MKQLIANRAGWRIPGGLLALSLGLTGLLVLAGCGEDDPAPATPAPAPAPAPEPEPEPEPTPEPEPAPTPVMATFSLPDDAKSSNPLIADDGDAKSGKARVNPELVVTSTTSAYLEAMFDESAGAVLLTEGENTPFANVHWALLQSAVVEDGATFRVTRTVIGAGQEMTETSDVAYVTCGPFQCVAGSEAPEIGLADFPACEGWNPELNLIVGRIDNDGADGDNDGDTDISDGIEMGWTYTSSVAIKANHQIGQLHSSGDVSAARGRNRPLPVKKVTDDSGASVLTTEVTTSGSSVVPCGDGYPSLVTSATDQVEPRECFRLSTSSDFLSLYEVTLKPQVALSWGATTFKGVGCEPRTFEAAAQVDMCELFEAEVEDMLPQPKNMRAQWLLLAGQTNIPGGFDVHFFDDRTHQNRYNELWYHDGSTPAKQATMRRFYADEAGVANNDPASETGLLTKRRMQDSEDNRGIRELWVPIFKREDDPRHPSFRVQFDPLYGDLGKIDITAYSNSVGDNVADRFPENPDAQECTAADGGKSNQNAQGNLVGRSTLCSAEDVEIPFSVVFADGIGADGATCQVKVDYTLTCDWSNLGLFNQPRGSNSVTTSMTKDNMDRFFRCGFSAPTVSPHEDP